MSNFGKYFWVFGDAKNPKIFSKALFQKKGSKKTGSYGALIEIIFFIYFFSPREKKSLRRLSPLCYECFVASRSICVLRADALRTCVAALHCCGAARLMWGGGLDHEVDDVRRCAPEGRPEAAGGLKARPSSPVA